MYNHNLVVESISNYLDVVVNIDFIATGLALVCYGVTFSVFVLILYKLLKFIYKFIVVRITRFRLTKYAPSTKVIAKRGGIVYHNGSCYWQCKVDKIEFLLPMTECEITSSFEKSKASKDEMYVEGSDIEEVKNHSVLSFLSVPNGDIVGHGFYMQQWQDKHLIVTAAHVLRSLLTKNKTYMVGPNDVQVEIDLRSCKLAFESKQLDIVAINVPQKYFSIMQAKPSHVDLARSGQPVQTVYRDQTKTVSSSGRVGKCVGPFTYFHSCTTMPGHSGAPVYWGKRIVGIHLGSHENRGNRFCALGYLIGENHEVSPGKTTGGMRYNPDLDHGMTIDFNHWNGNSKIMLLADEYRVMEADVGKDWGDLQDFYDNYDYEYEGNETSSNDLPVFPLRGITPPVSDASKVILPTIGKPMDQEKIRIPSDQPDVVLITTPVLGKKRVRHSRKLKEPLENSEITNGQVGELKQREIPSFINSTEYKLAKELYSLKLKEEELIC